MTTRVSKTWMRLRCGLVALQNQQILGGASTACYRGRGAISTGRPRARPSESDSTSSLQLVCLRRWCRRPCDEGGTFLARGGHGVVANACMSSLSIGAPIFVCQENRSSEEAVRFAFTVVLPYNSRSVELVAHGPTSADVLVARQEVSFAMLEKMVAATGYSICDYNYCTVARMQERWREIQDASLASMAQRIRLLEEENADLQHQVEMINEMLEE
ncbi:hypothetical protein AHAS_Ahas15G0108900 [Arachis hypogaea]